MQLIKISYTRALLGVFQHSRAALQDLVPRSVSAYSSVIEMLRPAGGVKKKKKAAGPAAGTGGKLHAARMMRLGHLMRSAVPVQRMHHLVDVCRH